MKTRFLGSVLFMVGLVLCAVTAEASISVRQTPYSLYRNSEVPVGEVQLNQFVLCDMDSSCPKTAKLTAPLKNPLATTGIRFSGEGAPVKKAEADSNVNQPLPSVAEVKKPEKTQEVEIHTTVHFDFNSFRLRPDEKEHIDAITSSSNNLRASVTGYTCDIGSKRYNLRLSLKRAQTVADYLKQKGVIVDHIEGKGECCPVSNDRALNRRVELTLTTNTKNLTKGGQK
jgi:outer membrane protein OmpA-like peptidoglycan-associated protein